MVSMGCPGRMVILFDCDPLLLQLFFQSQVLLFLHTTPSSTWTALRAKKLSIDSPGPVTGPAWSLGLDRRNTPPGVGILSDWGEEEEI